ncbi:MAG: Rrf2 family transcriptional regulator [Nitrospirota bacterium]
MFRLSVKLEYAILAVLSLIIHEDAGGAPLSVRAIAEKESLSPRFLEQAMNALKERRVIESVRGPHGGYRLSKSSTKINLADIVFAIEGDQTDKTDTRASSAFSSKPKILSAIAQGIDKTLQDYLAGVDFNDLARQVKLLQEREALTYNI